LVLGVIAASIWSMSMFMVAKSMSTKTGMALCCNMHVADEDQVYAGTITWSPAPQPEATTHMCSAAVPEFVVTAWRLPFHAANSSWNAVQLGPKVCFSPSNDANTMRRSTSSMGGHLWIVPGGTVGSPP
jgi:hypothetical protein